MPLGTLPPARVRRAPPQLALGLRVRRAAGVGHHHHADLTGEQPADEPRHAHRLLGAHLLRQRRQPPGDRGGVIVDDVVDPAAAALGRPQDIEDGELFVLQTRPVTA
jgi:hypothetical protein